VAAPIPREPPVTMANLPSRTRGALPVRLVEADLDDMVGLDDIFGDTVLYSLTQEDK
jgi:hypothetical protein